jgi:hypothetical protein
MAATATGTSAARLPGPPELLPGRPDAIVDLQTDEGAELVGAQWRYSDARVEEIDFVELGSPEDPLGPGTVPNRTFDVVPHAEAADYDDSDWQVLSPGDTMRRLANGRVCFNWYRTLVTVPERVGDLDPAGATVVFEVVIDDYAEVWVDGEMPLVLGNTGGQVVGGFNAPNRVILTRDARPGQTFRIAVFGINGPISASPRNYIWMRTATLDFYAAGRASSAEPATLGIERSDPRLDRIAPADTSLERVAGGFEFTEGPVWSPEGALLFSSPNTHLPAGPAGRRRHGLPLEERLHGRGHRALLPARLERPHLLAGWPADDLPARQPTGRPRQPTRRHHRARGRLRGQAAEQPERPRLPLGRHFVRQRPAVREAGHGR